MERIKKKLNSSMSISGAKTVSNKNGPTGHTRSFFVEGSGSPGISRHSRQRFTLSGEVTSKYSRGKSG